MLTICIVSARFYPQVVGSGTAAYSVANRLSALGYKVIVITDYSLKKYHKNNALPFSFRYVHGLESYATGKTSMQIPGKELYEHISTMSADILQVCNFMPMLLISSYRNLIKCPVVFVPYNTPILGSRSIGYYSMSELDIALAQFILKANAYDRLIAGSKAYYKSLVSLSAHNNRMKLSYLGIDLKSLITPQLSKEQVFRDYFGSSLLPNEPYIILPSRIIEQKGILNAVKALSVINRKHNIKLLLTGMHHPFNANYAEQINTYASALSITDKLVKPAKTIPRELLPIFYKSARLAMIPSLYEGLGLSAIEAQALGVPLIVSDTQGLDEVVTDGFNGLAVPPESPQKLAAGIQTLLENEGLAKTLARNAQVTVKKFDISRHVADLLSVYSELTQGH